MKNKLDKFNLDSLPTLPTVYHALMEKLEDPKATINDLADTIILDMSSTTRLLQIVNSSIFSFKNKVDTVSQAISLLGFNEVRNTIVTLAVTDYFRSFKRDKNFLNLNLWQHSIATGIIAEIIGKEIGYKKPEILFISGLLHDVGKLALITNFGKEYFDLLMDKSKAESQLIDLEKLKFGYSHDELGYELVKRWNIGDEIADSVKFHHHFVSDSSLSLNVCVVHLANIIAKLTVSGNSGNSYIEKPDGRIWEILNLRNGFLKSIYGDIEKEYHESSLLLKL